MMLIFAAPYLLAIGVRKVNLLLSFYFHLIKEKEMKKLMKFLEAWLNMLKLRSVCNSTSEAGDGAKIFFELNG